MRIAQRVAAAVGAIGILLVACSSGSSGTSAPAAKIYCAKSSLGCRCSTETFSLGQDESPVDSCGAGDWQCCFDLDAAGESTTCECSTYVCAHIDSSDECNCDFVPGASQLESADVRRSNCVKTEKDSLCCESTSPVTGHPCSCNGHYGTCEGRPGYGEHTEVSACMSSARVKRACSEKGPASSCAGLKWKAPASPSSSGGGGSSGSSSECTSDSSCSSKCSSDCYSCRSGSCKCGRRGVSGGCLY
ncbi:MAG: hypothetical protein KIT84_06985 [Labilithrix sp.]|nr:hypothetical protein [Labilithrix sp.]MCW5810739.1 hypothetical protein [Labilithrix sp.]